VRHRPLKLAQTSLITSDVHTIQLVEHEISQGDIYVEQRHPNTRTDG
jgi:hypothetical protein